MKLDLFSEPYSPHGNISAEGLGKSLGTPRFDRLRILFREAIQNSWDARTYDETGLIPRFEVHLRRLGQAEIEWFLENVFHHSPEQDAMPGGIDAWIESGGWILELSDFNTSGLGGPLRADQIIKDQPTDFVDFVRNIGSPRDRHHGGGTYGYGKSASYIASSIQTVTISSRTRFMDVDEDRFVVARLGPTFTRPADGDLWKRFTGRHWWGREDKASGTIDPLTGDDAAAAIRAIGAPVRYGTDWGTTVGILAPSLDGKAPVQVINTFIQAVLWFFWPKLTGPGRHRMEFRARLEGEEVQIPEADEVPLLEPYLTSIRAIRENGDIEGVHRVAITSGKEKTHLGWLATKKTIRLPRFALDTGDAEPLVPDPCRHIALMRAAELVVRYVECQEYANSMWEYGGVFVADESVEKEFAASEPPAHDDWVAENLEGKARTWVRGAKRKIPEETNAWIAPIDRRTDGDVDQTSLGAISDRLGGILLNADGERIGPKRSAARSGKTRSRRISGPEHIGFEIVDGTACSVFRIELVGDWNRGTRIRGKAAVLMEGGATTDPVGVTLPSILGWRPGGSGGFPEMEGDILVVDDVKNAGFECLVEAVEHVGIRLSVIEDPGDNR